MNDDDTIDFRGMVSTELGRLGKSCYWLGRRHGVSCHEDTIRLWLLHGKNIGAGALGEILSVLGFTVRPPTATTRKRLVAADT